MKKFQEKFFYYFYKSLFGLGLRIYYKEITVSGKNKIPLNSPIITASNHPTGLMDVFLASYHIKRQIKFTAAGSLFNNKLQAAFLTSVGTIPVYRRKDTPDEVDKNVTSFEHCFQELESRGAIGFYPEGTSHPEPWVNPIKTGAARVALQSEARNNFELNLLIIPIGINSPHPGAFRGSVFVNIGNPIPVRKYHHLYQQNAVVAVEQLTSDIQREMEACAFHIKDNLLLKIIDDLKTIGFDGINLSDKKIKGKAAIIYHITKALEEKFANKVITDAREENKSSQRFNSLFQNMSDLKNRMQKLGIVDHPFKGMEIILKFICLFFILILGLPIILPAIVANILPFLLSKKLGKKLAGKDVSLIPAGRLMIGTVLFLLFYLFLFIFLGCFVGLLKAIAICFFLLIGGYLTLWYWEAIKTVDIFSRKIYLWFTKNKEMRNLIKKRDVIFTEINDLIKSIPQ